jgi:hypothetical protein
MKNTKLVAILVLQAILVMGILAHVNGRSWPHPSFICYHLTKLPLHFLEVLTQVINWCVPATKCTFAADFFPKCCNKCRSFSGVDVCDDTHPKCPKGCSACRVVTTSPKKTFWCADMVKGGKSFAPFIN